MAMPWMVVITALWPKPNFQPGSPACCTQQAEDGSGETVVALKRAGPPQGSTKIAPNPLYPLSTHTSFIMITIGQKAGILCREYVEDVQASGLGNHDCCS